MKGEYLSKIVETDELYEGYLNLIYAPCGSGKTTFAKTELMRLHDKICWARKGGSPMLYLIDTAIGKEQLLRSEGAWCSYDKFLGIDKWSLPGITIMTYAGYATLFQKAPERDKWARDSIIVCDELHNAIKWGKWKQENNLNQLAVDLIANRVFTGGNLVVALSATPNEIRKTYKWCLREVELHGEPRHYENGNTEYYNNLELLLGQIQHGQRGIIYMTHIKSILKYEQVLRKKGFKTAMLWSIRNTEHPLTSQQKDLREYIIDNNEMPEDIDILFINKSCETSISIGRESKTTRPIDFMIIHSAEEDVQIQARGRYRNDLPELYLFDKECPNAIHLPEEWLNKPLCKADKDTLCDTLGFKDSSNGRLLKWTTVKQMLEDNGYIIEEKRNKTERFSIIHQ